MKKLALPALCLCATLLAACGGGGGDSAPTPAPTPTPTPTPTPSVTYAQVGPIIHARCVGCHSANPTIAGFNPAPLGIMFDTEAQVRADITRILAYAVNAEIMPYQNITGMTTAERATIATWVSEGMK